MIHKIFYIIALVLFFQGCNDKEKKIEFDIQIHIQSDSMKINIPIQVWDWKVMNDKISILSGNNRDYFLYIFSISDMNLLYKYGKFGQGPGEFIAVNWLNATNQEQIGLYDIPNLRMYLYQLSSDTLNIVKTYHFNTWDGKLSRPYSFIQQINDSIFLLKADLREKTEIEVANINTGEILYTFSNLLQRKPNTIYTPYYFGMAGNNRNFVLSYKYINRLELFKYKEADCTVEPVVTIGSNRDQSDNRDVSDYILHYTDVQCDEEYIYALYQGNKRDRIKNSIIEIYNWQGEPVKQIILDRFIELMTIDIAHGKIYGHDGNQDFDYIYIYDIK
jgi:hypothetical protein